MKKPPRGIEVGVLSPVSVFLSKLVALVLNLMIIRVSFAVFGSNRLLIYL